MDFTAFLADIRESPDYADQMVYVREVGAREPTFAEPAGPLAPAAMAMLAARGIARLYTHQAAALDAFRAGENPLVITGTASGKSLCYQIPLLEMLASDPTATALLLFPSKALAQDQFHRLSEALLAAGLGDVFAGVYDGDTPAALRRKLRDGGRVILTNPDMLHASMMPQHARWARFLTSLKLLVIDELHVYTGIFGSNVGNLFRRFNRVCRHYRSDPRLVAASATIGNPRELAESLTDHRFTLIDGDGSPRGKRTYVFWNPPRTRPGRDWRSRRSANVEAHELMALLIQRGVRTITFSKAKMTAEMIHRYVGDALRRAAPQLAERLSPYRGGYLAEERREIERQLFSGELMGVSTTRALELGIDVGGLDASILVGYPGTLASFFQQSGRAGRGPEDALVMLVGLDTAINQYIMTNPEYLFGRPVEEGVIDQDNPYVLTGHLRCTTHELALPDAEVPAFGPHAGMVLRVLEENLKVRHVGDRWFHTATETPQHEVGLRDAADVDVVIEDVDTGAVIGVLNKFDAQPILHPDAIYMHQGDTYRVLSLDLERNIARVTRVTTDYYTQPLGGTDVHHIDHCLREKPFGTGMAYWGEVTTHFCTHAFEKVRFYELDAISRHPVDLPYFILETMALWLVPDESLLDEVRQAGLDVHAGLRGIGYGLRMLLPLYMTCDTLDFSHSIGSANSPWQAIFIYERYPHGLGFTQRAYELLHELLPALLETVKTCACEDGCPCCVGKPLRGETTWNPERGEGSIPSKAAAKAILEGYLGDGARLREPDVTHLTDDPAAVALRLERSLRRRLEQGREPEIAHEIEPTIPTAYPDLETKTEALATPDVATRVDAKRNFSRELRHRIAKHIETGKLAPNAPHVPVPEGLTAPGGVNTPRDFLGRPAVQTEKVEPDAKPMGDSLAARAMKLKKRMKGEG